jgi:2-keto-4-pentenoate hydratase/2-oxohepta-3-ene-1,7-dioic acid hydratase in catechol pathway
MKLCTFSLPGQSAALLGALTQDGRVADLQAAHARRHNAPSVHLQDALAFLDGDTAARDTAESALRAAVEEGLTHPLSNVKLWAPVPRPRSIRDCMAFDKHIIQATRTVVKWAFPPLAWADALAEKLTGHPLIGAPRVAREQPVYYKSNVFSVVGTDTDVRWPSYSKRLDYELEFGAFVGRRGVNIPASRAREHLAAFTIFNDFSARDTQLREMRGRLGPAKGKDFDTGNAMGPYLVTADELPDLRALTMVARVNGQEWSRGSSRDMRFGFEDLVEHISREETLHPGEFIGSGTVGGGCGLELDRWIAPGDVVELEVTGLGVLRNRVVRATA